MVVYVALVLFIVAAPAFVSDACNSVLNENNDADYITQTVADGLNSRFRNSTPFTSNSVTVNLKNNATTLKVSSCNMTGNNVFHCRVDVGMLPVTMDQVRFNLIGILCICIDYSD